jgi:hypothetical protein
MIDKGPGVVCFLSLALSADAALAACAGGRAPILANQTVDRVMTVDAIVRHQTFRFLADLRRECGAPQPALSRLGAAPVVYTARPVCRQRQLRLRAQGTKHKNSPVTLRVAVRVVR